jgi:hypothetical protein
MTTNSHTPIPFGAPATSAVLEAPLGQLDAAIATVIATGSGTSTTLTAQANAGQASLTVASSAGFAPGDPIYIGTGAAFESRIVNTVPGGGVTITVTVNLTNTYAIGKPVSKSPVELVDARSGSTSLKGRLDLIRRGVINVKENGAIGDGTADDTSALQAALTAGGATSPVYLPSGTYKVSAQLNLVTGQVLIGSGWQSVIVRAAAYTGSVLNLGTDKTDILLLDFAIDGNRAGTTANGNGMIQALRPLRCRLTRLKVFNGPNTNPGIQFDGGTDNVISGCHFATIGYGAVIGTTPNAAYACDRNVVEHCTFLSIDLNGIFFTGSLNSTASTAVPKQNIANANVLGGCGDAAIETGIGCRGTIISNNAINGAGAGKTGILIRDNVGTLITGNTVDAITGTNGDGISVISQLSTNTDIVVGPNWARGCTRYGLLLQNGTRLDVTGGSYRANGTNGVLAASVNDLTLTGVSVSLSGGAGFQIGSAGAPVIRALINGCSSFDNGNAVANTYDGFVTVDAGTTDIVFANCQAYETRVGGARFQRYGLQLFQGTTIILGGAMRMVNNISGGIVDGVNAKGFQAVDAAAATGPANTIVKKIEVFDATGTSIGFIPVYTTVT